MLSFSCHSERSEESITYFFIERWIPHPAVLHCGITAPTYGFACDFSVAGTIISTDEKKIKKRAQVFLRDVVILGV